MKTFFRAIISTTYTLRKKYPTASSLLLNFGLFSSLTPSYVVKSGGAKPPNRGSKVWEAKDGYSSVYLTYNTIHYTKVHMLLLIVVANNKCYVGALKNNISPW